MSYVIVFGRLLASFFDAQAGPVPVTGRVLFTPNFTSEASPSGLHLPTRVEAPLDAGGSFTARLLTGEWSWKVEVIAKDQTGRTLTVPCFNFLPEPGIESVNLADIVPITDPVTAKPMLRGEAGVGIEAVEMEEGKLVFQLSDGTKNSVELPYTPPQPAPSPAVAPTPTHVGEGEWAFEAADGGAVAVEHIGDGNYQIGSE